MKKIYIIILATLIPYFSSAQSINDLSNESNIKIDEPQLAHINITGISSLPQTKTDNMHAWFEYSDEKGNYFKKRIIINAQGASSIQYPKKNLSIDFCEDEWVGDKTTDIQIGNWVKQDGFHLKGSWLDSFRGGLAVATAYKVYDDITADRPHILERAGLTDYSKKAKCHPDGFPCVLSLNGEFVGVYAWQLKKHRKNMGMEKDNSKHVHLDVKGLYHGLYMGQINWDLVEMRNPKVPTEEAIGYAEAMSRYDDEIFYLYDTLKYDNVQMHEEIGKRFDVASLIDMYLHGIVISNIDGMSKNAQFFTYDGQKWFITPYDLDETFGISWIGTFTFPAKWSFVDDDYRFQRIRGFPCWLVEKYLIDDAKERYAHLRDKGMLTTETILSHLKDWNERVGKENFDKEYVRWPSCPSNGKETVNEGWEWVDSWSDYSDIKAYKNDSMYVAGDSCVYDYRVWKSTGNHIGVVPCDRGGFTDTEERVTTWVTQRLEYLDDYLEYSSFSAINNINVDKHHCPVRKRLKNGQIIIVSQNGEYYTITGLKITM